jgi:hypothetical protein
MESKINRFARHGLFAGAALMFGSLIARAYDTSWIATGQTISAAKLKADLDETQTRIAVLEGQLSCPAETVDTGAGFCIDAADRKEGSAYPPDSFQTCANAGAMVCSFAQMCTAAIRLTGSAALNASYRYSDILFHGGNQINSFAGPAGNGNYGIVNGSPVGCTTLTAPGPWALAGLAYRCCRPKG